MDTVTMYDVWLAELWVCELSIEVHAACTVDVFGKQASGSPHDAGLDKQCTL
jgi:hypothetical protein